MSLMYIGLYKYIIMINKVSDNLNTYPSNEMKNHPKYFAVF